LLLVPDMEAPRTTFPTLAALAVTLLGQTATAQEIPCSRGPCMQPDRRGTHFLVEINGGGSISGNVGLAVGGVVGIGGKLRGFPLRFYLVGEVAYASGAQDGMLPGASLDFREERTYRDLALGLRTYVPVFGPLSLFVDLMGGGSYVSATLQQEGQSTLASQDWSALGLLAAGVQVRLFHHLSVGIRGKVVLGDDGLSRMREVVGVASPTRASVTAGLTWHF